jgi:hypothetical protein
MTPDYRCPLPPPGWWCSRPAGHEGPCAAREISDDLEIEISWGNAALGFLFMLVIGSLIFLIGTTF